LRKTDRFTIIKINSCVFPKFLSRLFYGQRRNFMGETQDFIMKPKIDFCFKELMEEELVRRGFLWACGRRILSGQS